MIRRVVTSRTGGVSAPPYDSFNLGPHVGDEPGAVDANRARLAQAVELEPAALIWMTQVHGRQVRTVASPGTEPPTCDALVTATPGVALAVMAADCVPVLLADPDAGVVGAAHAGRTGVATHVVTATVEAMLELGAEPHRIDVLLGPAICGRCYAVPLELAEQVEALAPGGASTTPEGAPALDLRAALAAELARLGVTQIVSDPRCTAEDRELFSYRRDGVTGRQAGLIWLPHR